MTAERRTMDENETGYRAKDARGGSLILAERGQRSIVFAFFSSRRRHRRFKCDWRSDVCSSDLRSVESEVLGVRETGYLHADAQDLGLHRPSEKSLIPIVDGELNPKIASGRLNVE